MRTLRGYRLIDELGRDFVRIGWKAQSPDGTLVYLEQFRHYVEDLEASLAFRARIAHENIPPLLEVLHEPREHRVIGAVYPFIPGYSLRTLMTFRQKIPVPMISRACTEAARALEATLDFDQDQRGPKARRFLEDLKPAHVRVGRGGHVWYAAPMHASLVADEMAERWQHRAHEYTWRPAEVLEGRERSRATWVWELGLVFYAATIGIYPFSLGVDVMSLIREVKAGSYFPLARSGLAEEVRNIIARALANEPTDRFQNVSDLAESLESLPGPLKPASREALASWAEAGAADPATQNR